MARMHFSRNEIGALAERLEARGTSRLLKDRPELQSDLRIAAFILRSALDAGFPNDPIEIDDTNGYQSVS